MGIQLQNCMVLMSLTCPIRCCVWRSQLPSVAAVRIAVKSYYDFSLKGRRSLGPQAAEDAVPLLEAMSSTNWSTRHESINDLLTIVNTKPRVLSAQSVKVRGYLFIGYLNECPIMQYFGIPNYTAKFQA